MKMNMTETEALQCVEKVKERKMGYLFENMEKIDIQAERKAADDARQALADYIENSQKEFQQTLEWMRKEVTKQVTEQVTEQVTKQVTRQSIVTMCQELGGTRELALSKLQEKCGLSLEEAGEQVEAYWKDSVS